MTPEEQRIAIAEACGWKWYRRPASGPWAAKPHRSLYHPTLSADYVSTLQPADMTERQCNEMFIWREGFIPDYLNDLNVIHEVEKTLTIDQKTDYIRLLNKGDFGYRRLAFATAAQRAEAFLITIGKLTHISKK